ncbi:MAG: hypothetical protein AAGA80_20675, partial [Cyanobacteria bacterium P01_F01_bin.143]
MKFRVPLKSWLTIFSTLLIVVACKPVAVITDAELPCDIPVIDKPVDKKNPLKISINVDGSGSMYGYIKNNSNSRYAQTITLLDSVVNLGSGSRSQVDVEHYRIGQKQTQQITDSQYQKARLPEFYDGNSAEFPEVFSHLDVAIANPENEDQLLILITDLDQQGSDLNKLNKTIQRTYFNKNLPGHAVGVLGIRSEYNHTVYSVNPNLYRDFQYTTQGKDLEAYRPFYIIFLGHYQDIIHYVDNIQQQKPELFNTSEFSLFYPDRIVDDIAILQDLPSLPQDLIRPFSLHNGKVAVEVDSPPYEIIEVPKRVDNSQPNLNYNLPFAPLKYSLPISSNSINTETEVLSYDFVNESFTSSNSNSLKRAMNLTDWDITDNSLEFTNKVNLDSISEPGIYIFKINAIANNFQDEAWWQEWDWASRIDNQDGSKTLAQICKVHQKACVHS